MSDFGKRHIRCSQIPHEGGVRIVRHDLDCKYPSEHEEQRTAEATGAATFVEKAIANAKAIDFQHPEDLASVPRRPEAQKNPTLAQATKPARLDVDGTAKPLTEIAAVVRPEVIEQGQCLLHDHQIASYVVRPSAGVMAMMGPKDALNATGQEAEQRRSEAQSENARLFEQFNLGLETAAEVVDKQVSIHRMRAQSFSDDSDRADGEAQADDIEREEKAAELLEYVASRIRAMLPKTSEIRRGPGSTAPNKTEPRPSSRVSEEDDTLRRAAASPSEPVLCDACGKDLDAESTAAAENARCHRTLGCSRERDHGGDCTPMANQPGDPTIRHVVAWMRQTYPQNQHAREWANEIERVFLRGAAATPVEGAACRMCALGISKYDEIHEVGCSEYDPSVYRTGFNK